MSGGFNAEETVEFGSGRGWNWPGVDCFHARLNWTRFEVDGWVELGQPLVAFVAWCRKLVSYKKNTVVVMGKLTTLTLCPRPGTCPDQTVVFPILHYYIFGRFLLKSFRATLSYDLQVCMYNANFHQALTSSISFDNFLLSDVNSLRGLGH